VCATVSLLLACRSAFAAEISGHIDLTPDGKASARKEAQDGRLFPAKAAAEDEACRQAYVMGTRHKQFSRASCRSRWQPGAPNQDPILNARHRRTTRSTLVVRWGEGQTFAPRMSATCAYCNVHHSMTPHPVLDTP
jgi:hypothetical protein